jgi:hypothetical protein
MEHTEEGLKQVDVLHNYGSRNNGTLVCIARLQIAWTSSMFPVVSGNESFPPKHVVYI